jgi:hypothetical protein
LLARIRSKRCDKDQADDVRGSGVADDRATVRVPDQQHRAIDLADHAGDVGGIGGHASQRICRSDDLITQRQQPLDDAIPAGRIGEGAVHRTIVGLMPACSVIITFLPVWMRLAGSASHTGWLASPPMKSQAS